MIIGASSDIGAAVARLFAEEGPAVVLRVRREERLVHVVAEVRAAGRQAVAVERA
ncbi:SDR family NAD(P)-dependent oxidoreductase [Streptomyces sp. NPDC048248]|uniref:SDR family NAD(P)-dependent oxidoreductase n=1 Tax=Streptomyces sp. NPDC048248 TaxID=3365523 RepID=UPI003715C1B3